MRVSLPFPSSSKPWPHQPAHTDHPMPAHGEPTTAPDDGVPPAERTLSGVHRADKLSAAFAVSIAVNQVS